LKFFSKIEVAAGCLTDIATKTGWLAKQGNRRKRWKQRYFILSGSSLFYFKKPGVSILLNQV